MKLLSLILRGTFNSNNLTIDRNGQPINSGTSNLVLNTNGQAITLVYVDATRGWGFQNKYSIGANTWL